MRKMIAENRDDNRAAIVCAHVAVDLLPILSAIRTEPLREEDSGWQFLCDSGPDEIENQAQVWAVSEVLAVEPSLAEFMDSPIGTRLVRANRNSKWVKADHTTRA
jgi:hypothetical protein